MAAKTVEFSLTPASRKLLEQIAQRTGPGSVLATFTRVMARQAQRAAAHVSKTALSGRGGLRRRTGNLARSIVGLFGRSGGNLVIRVGVFRGPALKYASIQEFGGTIVPVRRRFLAAPTDEGGALTPAGVHRYASAKDFPRPLEFVAGRVTGNLNRRRVRAGAGLFLASEIERLRAEGRDEDRPLAEAIKQAGLVPVYLLMRSSTIPPHFYLRGGFESYLATGQFDKDLIDELAALLAGGKS